MPTENETNINKPKNPRRKNGRPTIYKPEFAQLAKERCLLGATNDDLAEALGVDIESIKRWIREIPGFRTSIYEGRDGADARIANSLYNRANGYSHDAVHFSSFEGKVSKTPYTKHYPPDTEAAKWWLKNRRPDLWRDLMRQEITGVDGGPVAVTEVKWAIVHPQEEKHD